MAGDRSAGMGDCDPASVVVAGQDGDDTFGRLKRAQSGQILNERFLRRRALAECETARSTSVACKDDTRAMAILTGVWNGIDLVNLQGVSWSEFAASRQRVSRCSELGTKCRGVGEKRVIMHPGSSRSIAYGACRGCGSCLSSAVLLAPALPSSNMEVDQC